MLYKVGSVSPHSVSLSKPLFQRLSHKAFCSCHEVTAVRMLLHYLPLLGPAIGIFVTCIAAAEVILPKPQGPYGTAISTAKLVDDSRTDPFAPSNHSRALMISLFYPIPQSKCSSPASTHYMPPATAAFHDAMYGPLGLPNGTFGNLKLHICSDNISSRHRTRQYPVLLFSPGLGNSRLLSNSIAQSAASNGYVVVSIDHPYDASIVEFPDGSTVMGVDIETDEQIELALSTRTKDVSFVLNELSDPSTIKSLLPALRCGLNTNEVGIFGHSLGGATAISAMVNDSRIAGGVNLDGSFFGPVIQQGTSRPVLIVGHEGKNQTTDASWGAIWPNLRCWKLELEVLRTQHGAFFDFPMLVDALGLTGKLPAAVTGLLGTIDGPRDSKIIRVYLGAFFDYVLKGKKSHLLGGASAAYPEVVIIDM